MTKEFQIGDHVRIIGNAPGTVWESGIIECIQGDKAYIIYGATHIRDYCGVRGMCTGECLSNLEMI